MWPSSGCNVLYSSAFLVSDGILIWMCCGTIGAFYALEHEIVTYIPFLSVYKGVYNFTAQF